MGKNHHYFFWQKCVSSVLIFSLLFTSGFFLNSTAFAASLFPSTTKKQDLIVLAVSDTALKKAKNKIERYAEDVSKTFPEAQVNVLNVDAEMTEKNFADVLERLYFEGIQDGNTQSQLIGTVLIGNIPKPLLHVSDTVSLPSFAPYVDFDKKAFIFDEEKQYYVPNSASFVPEIWHGVIPFEDDRLGKYFDENHAYYSGEKTVKKEVLYADFIHEASSINGDQLTLYQNTQKFSEDIAYKRFTGKLLAYLTGGFRETLLKQPSAVEQQLKDIQDGDTKKSACLWGVIPKPENFFNKDTITSDATAATVPDMYTPFQLSKFLPEYGAVVKGYIQEIQNNIENAGRWGKDDLEYLVKYITVNDVTSREKLKLANDRMKEKLTQFVETQWQVPINVPTVLTDTSQNSTQYRNNIFYGKNASDISSVYECTWLRGSTENADNFSQMVALNRTFDVNANTCNGYAGCCVQSYSQPNQCNPANATQSVISSAGASKVTGQNAPSYKNCMEAHWRNFSGNPADYSIATKNISSAFVHDEPNGKTLQEQIDALMVNNLPVDGIPYIDFQDKDGQYRRLDFPNVFRANTSFETFLAEETAKLQATQKTILEYQKTETIRLNAELTSLQTQLSALPEIQNPVTEEEKAQAKKRRDIEVQIEKNQFRLPTLNMTGIPENFYSELFTPEEIQEHDLWTSWNTFSLSQKYQFLSLRHLFQEPAQDKRELTYLRGKVVGGDLVMDMAANAGTSQDIMYDLWQEQVSSTNNSSSAVPTTTETLKDGKCGSYNGVEIWEWPASVVCWINEIKNFQFLNTQSFDQAWKDSFAQFENDIQAYQNDLQSMAYEGSRLGSDTNNENSNSAKTTSVAQQNFIEPEKIAELSVPSSFTLFIDTSGEKALNYNILLKKNSTLLVSSAYEATIDLPSGIRTNEPDINEEKDGLQVVIFDGQKSILLFADKKTSGTITVTVAEKSQTTEVNSLDTVHLQSQFVKDSVQDGFVFGNLYFQTKEDFSGSFPAVVSSDNRAFTTAKNIVFQDGLGKVPVVYQSIAEDIPVTVTSDYFDKVSFALPANKGRASQFFTEQDEYFVQAGKNFSLDVSLIDSDGNTVTGDQDYTLYITPASSAYTETKSQKRRAIKGKDTIVFSSFQSHGDIHLALVADGIGMKLVTIHTRNIIAPTDITNTESLFQFFVEEGNGGDVLAEKMLESGSMAVAKKSGKPEIATPDFQLFGNGAFVLGSENIKVESVKNWEFHVRNTQKLETLGKWKLENIQALVKNFQAGVVTFSDTEKTVSVAGKLVLKWKDGVELFDNRYTLRVEPSTTSLVLAVYLEQNKLFELQVQAEKVIITPANSKLQTSGNNSWILASSASDTVTHSDAQGWKDEDQTLLDVASRMPFGDAFKYTQDVFDVFYGDPVLQYKIDAKDVSDAGFDATVGEKIYEGTEDLNVLKSFDYNKDRRKDLLIQEGDNRLVLLEGREDGTFIKRGDYGLEAGGISEIATGNFDGDGYDDILVANANRKILFFMNTGGHIQPDIEALNIDAKEIESMAISDTDQDGILDIVLSTSRGEFVVYYGGKIGFEKVPKIIANFGIQLTKENASADLRVTDTSKNLNFLVSLDGISYEIQSFADGNNDGIKDIQLASPKNPNPQDIGNGYKLISTRTASSVLALGNAQGTFRYNNITVKNSAGQNLQASQVSLPDRILIDTTDKNKSSSQYFPLQEVAGQKFYTSSDRNSLDVGALVTVHIQVSKIDIESKGYIVDQLPNLFKPISGTAQCNKKNCEFQTQAGEEKQRLIFGPFENEDIEIQYQAQLRQTPRIPFTYNDTEHRVEAPKIQKMYTSDRSRVWTETTYVFPPSPDVFAKDETVKSSLSTSATNALETVWGDPNQSSIESSIQSALDFLENLNCKKGSCLASPVNKAFLVPGMWAVAPTLKSLALEDGMFQGLAQSVNDVLPRIGIPIGPNLNPVPVFGISNVSCAYPPYVGPKPCTGYDCFRSIIPSCTNVPSPLDFRMYVSPTLTGGLGMAICKGPANIVALESAVIASAVPGASPLSTGNPLIGKCTAFALPVSEFVPACNTLNQKISDLVSQATSTLQSTATPGKTLFNVEGMIKNGTERDIEGYAGLAIGVKTFQQFLNKDNIQNDSTYPFFKGLFARWWDAQSSQFGKLLNLPTITFYFPQMDAVLYGGEDSKGRVISKERSELGKFNKAWEDFGKKTDNTKPASTNTAKTDTTARLKARENTVVQAKTEKYNSTLVNNYYKTLSSTEKKAWDSLSASEQAQKSKAIISQNNAKLIENYKSTNPNTKLSDAEILAQKKDPFVIQDTLNPAINSAKALDDNLFTPASSALNSGLETINSSTKKIEDSFAQVFELVENIPFVTLEQKRVDITIPWINPQELDAVITELEMWLLQNEKEIERFASLIEQIQNTCKGSPFTIKNKGSVVNVNAELCNKTVGLTAPIDLRNLVQSVKENIETLRAYRDYPKKLSQYKTQLAYYFVDALKYVNSLMDVLGGWIARNKLIVEKYILLYYTVTKLIDEWKNISVVFEDYMKTCNNCKADVYSQNFSLYNMLFAFIPTPPVIVFPRWPDIVFDMSHVQAGVKIVLPDVRFHVEEVSLNFNLDPIRLPDLSFLTDLKIDFGITIPKLPVLPQLPVLPDLPRFPSLPLPQLPDLPPPPKLPTFLDCISGFTDIIRMLLRMYCLVMSGLWVYPESELTRVIESLTNRSSGFMLPTDFMQLQWPDISYPWIDEIRVDGYLTVEPELDVIQKPVEDFADQLNQFGTGSIRGIGESINDALNGVAGSINKQVQSVNDASNNIDTKGNEMKQNLEDSIEKTRKKTEGLLPTSFFPSVKNLETTGKLLSNLAQQNIQDAKTLAFTNTPQSGPNAPYYVSTNGSMQVLLDNYNTATAAQVADLKKSQDAASQVLSGLYVTSASGVSSNIVKDATRPESVHDMLFLDYDQDGDEDVFYLYKNALYKKTSFEADDLSQENRFSGGSIRILDARKFLPTTASVNNLEIEQGNEEITASWLDEDKFAGYVLERKNLVYGFDGATTTNSSFIFLLKSPLFTEEKHIKGKSTVPVGKTNYSIPNGSFADFYAFDSASYTWQMPNDFYYLRIYGLTDTGKISTVSEQRLLAPQKRFDTRVPSLIENGIGKVPVLKATPIQAGVIYDESSLSYRWDFDQNGTIDAQGENVVFPASETLGVHPANVYVKDSSNNNFQFTKKIQVYAPAIVLDSVSQAKISGHLPDKIASMPFALLRKRDGKTKLILPSSGSRYFTDENGNFAIDKSVQSTGFSVRDAFGNEVAFIHQQTGVIRLKDNNYSLQALSATPDHPTQVIILNEKGAVAARVSYSAEQSGVVALSSETSNASVLATDIVKDDNWTLVSMPASAYNFQGGAVLIDGNKVVHAAISPEGDIRVLSSKIQLGASQSSGTMQFLLLDTATKKPLAKIELKSLAINTSFLPSIIPQTFADETAETTFTEDVPGYKEAKNLKFPFTDINTSHPYYQAIKDLYDRNILKGYDDGSFHPNAQISRAEFVKIALGASTCFDCANPTEETKQEFTKLKPFPDVNLTDWFYYCISIAKKEKMVTGYGDGQFHPQKNISRKEAVAVLLRQAEVKLQKAPEKAFTDVPEYDWAKDYVYTAVQLGLMKNQGGFTFPNEEITRGEFAMMASRILELRACQIKPEYQDTHDYTVGKLPEEQPVKQTPTVQTLSDGTKVYTFPDGHKEIVYPDGNKDVFDTNGNKVSSTRDQSKPAEPSAFGGICPEFSGGLCPVLNKNYNNLPGILANAPLSGPYKPLTQSNLSNVSCSFVDRLEDVLPGDTISAIILSTDGKRVFSKSNEITVK